MRVCMVVRSAARLDSRVLRVGDALAGAGHDVTCVGYRAATDTSPLWPVREVDGSSLAGWERRRHAALLPVARLPSGWKAAYWSDRRVRLLYEQVRAASPQVIQANDWDTLPVAARVAEETGARFVYDSHEFAVHEHELSNAWRLMYLPFTRAIERTFIHRAAAVMTVSESLALEIQKLYRLARTPTTVRNVPETPRLAPRPLGDRINVLYHGGVARSRGMTETAASLRDWPADFHFTIRGNVPADILDEVVRAAPGDRITIERPVAPADVVPAANAFDIGIHPSIGEGKQDEYSLPNKFFEYLYAGLAICVTDYAEMSPIVRAHGLGRLIARPATPATIADAICGFTRENLFAFKQASHLLSSTMTWSAEAAKLTDLYRELFGS